MQLKPRIKRGCLLPRKTTISLIKCDVGSLAGHHIVPKPLFTLAEKRLQEATRNSLINNFLVFNAGDDLDLLMVHEKGEKNHDIHKLSWDTFKAAADKALEMKLCGAGQDILKNAFSGNVRGMGPGVAEMEIEERRSDPVIVFAADKTSAGSFNYPLFRMFADPMNTAGLVIDPHMLCGFKFEVIDAIENKSIILKCPEETYELLALIGTVGRYVISHVKRADDNLICASSSASKCTVFDGPPRIVALGFQVADGRISSDDDGFPMIADLFDDPAFALARHEAIQNASTLRRMGEFEPARLSAEEMEYTTIKEVLGKLGE